LPDKVVIDKSGANALALHNMNVTLWLTVVFMLNLIEVVDVKYLHNIVEQSHRPIKQKMVQALGWKSLEGATATMSGQEVWTQIKRGQVDNLSLPFGSAFTRSLHNCVWRSARLLRLMKLCDRTMNKVLGLGMPIRN
jgi:transposase-like protein